MVNVNSFKSWLLSSKSVCFGVILLLEILNVTGWTLQNDLVRLSEILPGVYSNSQQYLREAKQRMPSSKSHYLMRCVFRPVNVSFLQDSFNVYAEQHNGGSSFPYRRRLYSFKVDDTQRAIRMRIFNFRNEKSTRRFDKDANAFRKLKSKDLITQGDCDMFWRRLNKKTFIGATGRDCLGHIKGETVRISVSTTLTSNLIQTHEGWYRVKDGSKVVEIEVPYNLIKVKSLLGVKYSPPNAVTPKRHPRTLFGVQNDLPKTQREKKNKRQTKQRVRKQKYKLPNYRQKTLSSKFYDGMSNIPSANSAWALQNFRSLLDALSSGRAVYFVVELSTCSLPAQAKIDRTSFGDYVNVYEHIKLVRGKKREFIRFSQKKFLETSGGSEVMVREITVYKNGKIIVRLRTSSPDDDGRPVTYAATCRLYDYDASIGDVKFTTDPFKNIKKISTFGFLRSSLKKGRRVRMAVDLSKCSGSTTNSITRIGGEIHGYDFLNSGREIEFTLIRPVMDRSRDGISERYLIGRILSNGDSIFTDTSEHHRNAIAYKESMYRCSVIGNKVSKNKSENSVKLFYL